MSPVLEIEALSAWYGEAQILFDVDLTLGRGEVVALMGRNGAGKSTTLKAIMGLGVRVDGAVRFLGQSIVGAPAYRIARAGLGYVPEDRRIFKGLTLEENLDIGRHPPRTWPDGRPAPSWTQADLFRLFPNLARMPGRAGGAMSGGEQQMLTVARTLMSNPLALLLDEPSEGVAPLIVEEMAATVRALKAEGLSVLLCEQNLGFARAVADRAVVLEQGRVCFSGTMDALVSDPDAQARYLGV
ncbi:ABC transporter ATP-binding protein [Amorphus orientalis]|uniref:Branched-chain amino acid transport system ATP-binding protein n=1 Tax=Amorphus orientalis TaxID=649198 RepID=A0AAE3VQ59_9HYPH|nr:ABC transporter ATP-binding protein [Amorphus orientalis]MDQ0316008.1 branched-chain amino acid transport system ATP-binding protein [Amorphus orientalis]